jgi:cell division protein FtsA
MEEIVELVHREIITSGFEGKLAGGIVLTGGGSQLSGIKQLFEYMTGMDARIGYPNEHLGKSKTDEVKTPMYATSVGLVLSGFWALDDRENRYNEFQMHAPKSKKERNGREFFQKIIDKTRGLLIDDLDNKTDY